MNEASAKAEQQQVEAFVAHWSQSSGAERANFQSFAKDLCNLLGVPEPEPAKGDASLDSYVFEHGVKFKQADGSESPGRIDLYKKGAFVLEAKQSRLEGRPKAIPGQNDLFVTDTQPQGRRSANRGWDVLMMNARRQAEEYAKALPPSHGWPPFILVCDVGHCIEVYADFSGQGKNYAQFPDRQGFRIFLEDLRKEDVRERLKRVWTDPQALDPARNAAKVTREIAARLAQVSKALEKKEGYDAEKVALFLMRCLSAIFGTLLEQALDKNERRRLGAHYTPRAYVERIVVATIMEPLRQEWAQVQATAERFKHEKKTKEALAVVKRYVMYWWDRAAELASSRNGPLRFGLVTTNSITQVFSRRVVAKGWVQRSPFR